jgi:hypothetical protein
MKITFAESSDVTDISGAASFDASGLVCLGMAQGLPPGMRPVAALPARDGSYSLYGQVMDIGGSWSLWRARTVDGRIYSDAEQVCASGASAPSGRKWVGHATMSRRGGDGRLFFFKWSHGEGCLAMWAFASADGATWTCCSDGVLFEDHDSNTIVWDDVTGQFIDFQTTYKRASKPFDDNIGQSRRRVMFLRRSPDGIAWTPGDWVRGAECLIPEKYLICPDDKDPAELEFYRFFPFRQDGRYVGMQLNYAASPGMLNTRYRTTKHGPHLSCEWWLSDDGFTWRRPFRHVIASGESDGLIQHEPMRLGQDLLWTDGQKVYGLLRERIFCIRSLPNAAFATRPFQMPASPVAINAEFGFDGNPRRGMRGQGAIMIEVLGAEGQVLTGFDRDGCVIHDLDTPSQRLECDRYGGPVLTWHGRQPTELAGQTVRMRVHFRDARIYDLRWP